MRPLAARLILLAVLVGAAACGDAETPGVPAAPDAPAADPLSGEEPPAPLAPPRDLPADRVDALREAAARYEPDEIERFCNDWEAVSRRPDGPSRWVDRQIEQRRLTPLPWQIPYDEALHACMQGEASAIAEAMNDGCEVRSERIDRRVFQEFEARCRGALD